MKKYQTGIIEDNASSEMFLLFNLTNATKLVDSLQSLAKVVDGSSAVAGFGNQVMQYFPQVAECKQHQFNSPLMSDEAGCDLAIWLKMMIKVNYFIKQLN